MDRNEVVDCIKSGNTILGLKLDAAGRLIEDHSHNDDYDRQLNRIKKIIIDAANNGNYSLDLEEDPKEYSEAEKIAYRILKNENSVPDHWEVHDLVLGAAKELAEEHKLFIGAFYCSDEMHNFCISKSYENTIQYLASQYRDLGAYQEYDSDYLKSRFESAMEGKNDIEAWIEFGNFEYTNLFEAGLVLEAVSEVGGEAQYGETGYGYL